MVKAADIKDYFSNIVPQKDSWEWKQDTANKSQAKGKQLSPIIEVDIEYWRDNID